MCHSITGGASGGGDNITIDVYATGRGGTPVADMYNHPPQIGAAVLSVSIAAIIVGLIVGALGRLVVPGRQNISIWVTIAIGIVAALIGGVIANALGVGNTNGIDWIKLIIQVALAAVGVALVAGSSRSRSLR